MQSVRIPPSRGVFEATLCDKVCQWLATGRWFSPGTPVSSTNKTDRHDITEILLKVSLNTTTITHNFLYFLTTIAELYPNVNALHTRGRKSIGKKILGKMLESLPHAKRTNFQPYNSHILSMRWCRLSTRPTC
jgi:hypothetical protein